MRRYILGATACLLLSIMAAGAEAPDQLYQTWQKNYLSDPEVAEKAAQQYEHQAPHGPQAQDLQIWLDAYHKALAAILTQPRTAGKPPDKLASAEPAAPPEQALPPPAPTAPLPVPPMRPSQVAPPAPARNARPAAPVVKQAAAPQDHHTEAYHVLADAYHKAMAGLGSAISKYSAANSRVAQSSPPPKPPAAAPVKLAALSPPPPPPPSVQVAPPQMPPPDSTIRQAAVPPIPEPPPPEVSPTPRPIGPPQLASAIPPRNARRSVPIPEEAPAHSPLSSPASESVDDTLAFIADKIESEDRLSFTAEFYNASGGALLEQLVYLASNVTIDPNRCQVSYRWHVQQDGRPTTDQDRAVQLRLAKSISVVTVDQALDELNARRFTAKVFPEAWAVHIARWDKPVADNLYFHDKGMADSVAGAAQHALDLCDKKADRFAR